MKTIRKRLWIFCIMGVFLASCTDQPAPVAQERESRLIADFLGVSYIRDDGRVVRVPFSEEKTRDYGMEIGILSGYENIRALYAMGDAFIGAITETNEWVGTDGKKMDGTPLDEGSGIADYARDVFKEIFVHCDGTVTITEQGSGVYEPAVAWSHVVQAVVEGGYAFGLTEKGILLYGESIYADVYEQWTDLTAIYPSPSAGSIMAVKADGTVAYYTGDGTTDRWGIAQCVSEWHDIVALAPGYHYVIGLCADGSVVAAGDNAVGQCDVSDWKDIVAIATSSSILKGRAITYTVGLDKEGQLWITGVVEDIPYHGVLE